MNIENDARAFSRIGAAIVLNEWESFWNVDSEYDLENALYENYLAINLAEYKNYIPEEVLNKIMKK